MSPFKDKNMILKCLEIVHLQRKEAILNPPNWMKRFRTTQLAKLANLPTFFFAQITYPIEVQVVFRACNCSLQVEYFPPSSFGSFKIFFIDSGVSLVPVSSPHEGVVESLPCQIRNPNFWRRRRRKLFNGNKEINFMLLFVKT